MEETGFAAMIPVEIREKIEQAEEIEQAALKQAREDALAAVARRTGARAEVEEEVEIHPDQMTLGEPTPMVRTDDPPESAEAAAGVEVKRDRLLVLRAFARIDGPATFHDAADIALRLEGTPTTDIYRHESLRRRGSDLRALGLIAQAGKRQRKATFLVTEAGRGALDAEA